MAASTSAYMLYHQNNWLQRKPGSSRLSVCQTFSPWISAFGCSQKRTSAWSRKYEPLPTIPCCDGGAPVRIEACTVEVTAGNTGCRLAILAVLSRVLMCGVASPNSEGVSPTTLISSSGCSEGIGVGLLHVQQVALAQLLFDPAQLSGDAGQLSGLGSGPQFNGQHAPAVGFHLQHRAHIGMRRQVVEGLRQGNLAAAEFGQQQVVAEQRDVEVDAQFAEPGAVLQGGRQVWPGHSMALGRERFHLM